VLTYYRLSVREYFSTERTGKRRIRVQNIDSPLLAIDFLTSSRVAAGSETVGELTLFSIRASLGRRGWPLARLPLPRGSFALPAPGRMPSYKCPFLQSPHQSRIGATQQIGHHASLFFISIPSFLSFPLFLLLSSTPSLCFTS
jgi:hypothetical protein